MYFLLQTDNEFMLQACLHRFMFKLIEEDNTCPMLSVSYRLSALAMLIKLKKVCMQQTVLQQLHMIKINFVAVVVFPICTCQTKHILGRVILETPASKVACHSAFVNLTGCKQGRVR